MQPTRNPESDSAARVAPAPQPAAPWRVAAVQTNMLEAPEANLDWDDGGVELDLRPFEVRTIRLRLA